MQSRTSHGARRHHALNFKGTYAPYRPIGRLWTGRDGEGTKKKNLDPKRVCKPITYQFALGETRDLLKWGVHPRREHLSIQFPPIRPLLLPLPPGPCALTKYNDSPKTIPIFSAIKG